MHTVRSSFPARPHARHTHAPPFPQTLEAAEEKLDNEIEQLERLDEDEMERMRRRRMDELKKVHQQKQQWTLQVSPHRAIGGRGARVVRRRVERSNSLEVSLERSPYSAPLSAKDPTAHHPPPCRCPRPTPPRATAPTTVVQGHGEYRECNDQKQFFDDLRKESRAVVHFARSATRRCEILDKHLAALARKHIETKFIRVDAEKSPFLAERLKIWMLPTVVLIKDGKTDHSIVGFDELGGKDEFPTAVLEQLLLKVRGGGGEWQKGGQGAGRDASRIMNPTLPPPFPTPTSPFQYDVVMESFCG